MSPANSESAQAHGQAEQANPQRRCECAYRNNAPVGNVAALAVLQRYLDEASRSILDEPAETREQEHTDDSPAARTRVACGLWRRAQAGILDHSAA